MPLAARASACFPLLFQPVEWEDKDQNYYFVDGGIADTWGLEGLVAFPSDKPKRVVHIAVGDYDGHRGPSTMPEGVTVSEIVSISIRNTPSAGPLAMENGPKAVESSRMAMLASLDLPLYRGKEPGHYILHIDATEFIPS
jgi:predicted acylesterase/phospholipase RssA